MTHFVQYDFFCRKKGRFNGDCTILSLYKRPSDSQPWQTQLSTVVPNDLTATWLPPAGGLIFEEPCSSLTKQWVALSLQAPTVQWVTCKKGLSLACFWRPGRGAMLLFPSCTVCIFTHIGPCPSHSQRAAPSANRWQHQRCLAPLTSRFDNVNEEPLSLAQRSR